MTYEQIVSFWGGVEAARKALGVGSRQTLYNWRDKGIPTDAQLNAEVRSNGKLRADLPKEVRA